MTIDHPIEPLDRVAGRVATRRYNILDLMGLAPEIVATNCCAVSLRGQLFRVYRDFSIPTTDQPAQSLRLC